MMNLLWKHVMLMGLLLGLAVPISAQSGKRTSQKKAIEMIEAWYAAHPDAYVLDVNGDESLAQVTCYHPEREDEPRTLIVVNYKGMDITLAFDQALNSFRWSAEALQAHCSRYSGERVEYRSRNPFFVPAGKRRTVFSG